MTGLHTLVDGLAFSPTSPIDSPPAIGSSDLSSSLTAESSNHSSIFNNPSSSSTAVTSPANTPRLQSFGSRRINYGQGGSSTSSTPQRMRRRNSDPIVKEVDDPSTTTPTALVNANKVRYLTPSSFSKLFSTHTLPPRSSQRNSSHKGSDNVKLEEFLYNRGFLEGACSDVTIIAFGTQYNLHRLILDRSPYFSSCLNGGPWKEAYSSEISITPQESDSNITQHAFELALGRLYGHIDDAEEDRHAMPLLAAASYLDMQDLVESCVSSLLRNLKTSNIAQIIKFVTSSYYGPVTDRLLDSAKAMLYREGWEMEMTEWDGISGEIAAEIIGYDGFYVPDEWLRYCFVKEIIDWRLCHGATRDSKATPRETSETFLGEAGGDTASDDGSIPDEDDTDIKPLRDLLENGIYYMHMTFEELQKISEDKDVLGRKAVADHVIRDALWQQMLLRQRVLNAPEKSAELGITEREPLAEIENDDKSKKSENFAFNGKTSQSNSSPMLTPMSSTRNNMVFQDDQWESRFGHKYYIPMEDSTTVIGDHQEVNPVAVIPNNPRGPRPSIADGANTDKDLPQPPREEPRYSTFPPFRFSAEFRAVKQLREKKRVYSKTVFYAGSHWNIYIQKVRSSKNVQLGVYLHRAKDRESALNIAATGYAHLSAPATNPDGTPASSSDSHAIERSGSRPSASGHDFDNDGDTTLIGSIDISNPNHPGRGSPTTRISGGTTTNSSTPPPGTQTQSSTSTTLPAVPAISYYTDSRPTVQTYFKIFSPSKKGKVLSMFSSGPDSFNFSQSWGWKSSSLILDESLIAEGDADARLRFMVVLGNV